MNHGTMTAAPLARYQAFAQIVVSEQGQVEAMTDQYVVILKKSRWQLPQWVLHILLSGITLGLWLPIWALLAFLAKKGERRAVYSVNEQGQMMTADPGSYPLQWVLCSTVPGEQSGRHSRQQDLPVWQ